MPINFIDLLYTLIMDRLLLFIFASCFLGLCTPLLAQKIVVTSEIDRESAYQNQPLKGSITVTHDQSEKIDVQSFRLDKNKLNVKFVRDVQIAPNHSLIISIYHFNIPPKSSGLYALPSVSVNVGGEEYRSFMSSYTVEAAQETKTNAPPPPSVPPEPTTVPSTTSPTATTLSSTTENDLTPILRLEASIDGPSTLHPGQRTTFVYHYYYRGNLELTVETLPLLDAKGMIKIGEKEIKSYSEQGISITSISQTVEAAKPGSFLFGPSVIEGYAYQEDPLGKHIRTSSKLTSTAQPVTVNVLPFPSNAQPSSFNGAIGKYAFAVFLKSPPKMFVGDEILLEIAISGEGNLQVVPLPNIAHQPGFEGFFKLSDMPPEEKIEGNTKKILLSLRPLSNEVHEIPRIEFSSFEPGSNEYNVQHSKPISITVNAAEAKSLPENFENSKPFPRPKEMPTAPLIVHPPSQSSTPLPIEIETIFKLQTRDLNDLSGGTWWALALLPLGIGLWLYQLQMRQTMEIKRQEVKKTTGDELLKQALEQPVGSSLYFEGINKALKTALAEEKILPSADVADESMPKEGLAGEVRAFLCDIEEKRFAGRELFAKNTVDYDTVKVISLNLIEKIYKKNSVR